jgi:hypothetical protein
MLDYEQTKNQEENKEVENNNHFNMSEEDISWLRQQREKQSIEKKRQKQLNTIQNDEILSVLYKETSLKDQLSEDPTILDNEASIRTAIRYAKKELQNKIQSEKQTQAEPVLKEKTPLDPTTNQPPMEKEPKKEEQEADPLDVLAEKCADLGFDKSKDALKWARRINKAPEAFNANYEVKFI